MVGQYDTCVAFTLKEEGGWANDPNDPGGATMKGITFNVFKAWRHGEDVTPNDLRAISDVELHAIYKTLYWNAAACDRLPTGLDLQVFDMGVNAGVRTSVRLLQHTLGCEQDGFLGPDTLAAIAKLGSNAVKPMLAKMQETHYRSLPGYARYGGIWIGRTERRLATALKMQGV